MAEVREAFPPASLTPEEAAAAVGRYWQDEAPEPPVAPPADEGAQPDEEVEPDAPDDTDEPNGDVDEPNGDVGVEGAEDAAYESMTVAELKAELDTRGIDYASAARKADLIDLLEQDDAQ
jgi:hypothetical protein